MAKKKPVAKPKKSEADDSSARLIRAHEATAKQLRGKQLTQSEARDAKWLIDELNRKSIDEFIAAVPKGVYCQLASRQHKLIDDAARVYGLPLEGKTINLQAAITALHQIIADNSQRIFADEEDGQLDREKLRQQIAKLKTETACLEIRLDRESDNSIDRGEMRQRLIWLSAQLRTLGDLLGRRYGKDAQQAMNEFLRRLADQIEQGQLAI